MCYLSPLVTKAAVRSLYTFPSMKYISNPLAY